MKFRLIVFLLLIAFIEASAQQDYIAQRTQLDPKLEPFYHGVASGDPLPDKVIIWTRITPGQSSSPITVSWEMATDTSFANSVRNGAFTTDASADFTVKVDADNLQPNTWYYYRFIYNGRASLTGRTRTAPVGSVDSLRFAVASCADYADGYYHAYRKIAERNDIDAVIHLGDYIYENGSAGIIGRPHDPPKKLVELNDYRQRYSQYRLDPDLQLAHQMYPFINVWDDHEFANNSWSGGAEAHDNQTDGPYEVRKRMAVQAFYEWQPIRKPDNNDSIRIYRSLHWGNLLDLFMLDTRIIARDEQVSSASFDDPSRQMLGFAQLNWLSGEMQNSTAQWKTLGQQVVMAPVEAPIIGPINGDQWNGYNAERNRLYDTISMKGIHNIVVLTGDIHMPWANNLEHNGNPLGVEFVCASITTPNAGIPISQSLVQTFNPFVKYVDFDDHGYFILDVNQSRVQADFYQVGDLSDPNDNSQTEGPYWYTSDNTQVLAESQQAAQPRADISVLQPSRDPSHPGITGVGHENPVASVIGTYPNPFWENFLIKTYLFEPAEISVQLFNANGSLVKFIEPGKLAAGLHYIEVKGKDLTAGAYTVQININNKPYGRTAIKI